MKKGQSGDNILSIDYDRIDDKAFGSHSSKINEKKNLFSSDISILGEVLDEDDFDFSIEDSEIGINKLYCKMHDSAWANDAKNAKSRARMVVSQELLDILGNDFNAELENIFLEE